MLIHVQTVIGPTGLPEPGSFALGERQLQVESVIDRWPASGHSYFKLQASDHAIYILRLDEETGQWEMTLFQSGPG